MCTWQLPVVRHLGACKPLLTELLTPDCPCCRKARDVQRREIRRWVRQKAMRVAAQKAKLTKLAARRRSGRQSGLLRRWRHASEKQSLVDA